MAEIENRVRNGTDLTRCKSCGKLMYIYVFNNGDLDTIHKHGDFKVEIPTNYVPINSDGKPIN